MTFYLVAYFLEKIRGRQMFYTDNKWEKDPVRLIVTMNWEKEHLKLPVLTRAFIILSFVSLNF